MEASRAFINSELYGPLPYSALSSLDLILEPNSNHQHIIDLILVRSPGFDGSSYGLLLLSHGPLPYRQYQIP